MELELKYYKDKLLVINPQATVTVVCCWDDKEQAYNQLEAEGCDTSKIACIGNLYGKGFRYLVRSLFLNPQINTVVFVGEDKDKAAPMLRRYLKDIYTDKLDTYLDSALKWKGGMLKCSATNDTTPYNQAADIINEFGEITNDVWKPRVDIPVEEYKVKTYPSNINDHSIVAETVKEAHDRVKWEINRFGEDVTLAKGLRRELRNLKVEINKPVYDTEYRAYQEDMINPERGQKMYTYGNRLRGEYDTLEAIRVTLNQNEKDDRRCHMSTWQNHRDVMGSHRPCMLGVTFRKENGRLYATATFRSHNAMNAWHMNAHGIIGYMEYVRGDLELGTVTIISHSISIDPAGIIEIPQMRCELSMDPNGIFTFGTEGEYILATHTDNSGNILHVYKQKKASAIVFRIARDKAVSELSHMGYIGRQLERCESAILNDTEYIEK